MKDKHVKSSVDKLFTKRCLELLTGCQPDVTTLYAELFTAKMEWQQKQKSEAAKLRYHAAVCIWIERVKYGWHHGIMQRPLPPTRVSKTEIPDRRIRALLTAAQAAGYDIAQRQIAEINRRHASHLKANEVAT